MTATVTDIDIHRLGAKLFAANPEVIDPLVYVGVFHRWIQARDLDGTPIDVADYKHVPKGPGVMLISHEADRAIDFAGDRAGVVYQRKRDLTGSLEERLVLVLELADAAAARLEGEDDTAGVRFDRNEVELRFNDRRLIPNDDAGLELVRPAVEAALAQARPGLRATITRREDDPKGPLQLLVTLS